MKTAIAFVIVALLWGLIGGVAYINAHAATPSDCGLIRDHDTRRECYARTEHRPSDCGLIYDNDERRFCRAQSGGRH